MKRLRTGSPGGCELTRFSRRRNRRVFVAQARGSSRVHALPGIHIHSVRYCGLVKRIGIALLSPITAATRVAIVAALSGNPVDWMEKSPTNIDKRADDVRTISPVVFKMCFGRSGR